MDSSRALVRTGVVRAAEYVRMSTDHQKYSTENQSNAIRQYAASRGIDVVRTYADAGKSGLSIERRDALQRLIADVQSGDADFKTILVYDVSRWGRFQDTDESAYYEYTCKRAGITVQYCAEQFENDGSPVSAIIKGIKRAMAGEYSRELSAKVFAGQCRLIELGYRQGGPAGYGFRRILLDESGDVKSELAPGQQKSILTDRVVLGLGPEAEGEIVREIFRRFVRGKASTSEIAAALNERRVKTECGGPWTRSTIYKLLTNEKYVGNSVWNRCSLKLKSKRVNNHPDSWIRADDAFPAIVDRSLFDTAQKLLKEKKNRKSICRLTDEEMLDALHALGTRQPSLSIRMIDKVKETPSARCYRRRFGSILNAYTLAGHPPEVDYRFMTIKNGLYQLYCRITAEIISGLREAGCHVELDPKSRLIGVNRQLTLRLAVVHSRDTLCGSFKWRLRCGALVQPDIVVMARMDAQNRRPLDYYLLPRSAIESASMKFHERAGWLDAYRFNSLDILYEFLRPVRVTEAANAPA
nr:recombinase family protein [Methylovirgula sp. HY1]